MAYSCTSCGESYEDEWLLTAHQELFHNARPSVIHYAPPASRPAPTPSTSREEQHELVAEAMEGRVVRHFKTNNRRKKPLNTFLEEVKRITKGILEEELDRLNFLKIGIVLDCLFVNQQNETSPRSFISKNKVLMETTDLDESIEDMHREIVQKITEHEGRGSGWSLLEVISMDLRVHKHGYGDRGSSYIPLPKSLASTLSCINVQNEDNECFRYSMLAKFLNANDNPQRPSNKYHQLNNRYNFNGLTYPVSVRDIERFERVNPRVSVNVFGVDSSKNVYPIKVVAAEKNDHTDLLLLKNGAISHYVYIKDFNRLINNQLTRLNRPITVCKRCFGFANKPFRRGGAQWLREHSRLCQLKPSVRTIYPQGERAVVTFNKTSHQYRIPIVVYADFESSLCSVDPVDVGTPTREKYQSHQPNSFCLQVVSTVPDNLLQRYGLSTTPLLYRGPSVVQRFINTLYDISSKVETMYKHIVPMKTLSVEEMRNHTSATTCYICSQPFTMNSVKVRDHDHLTGQYRGPACNGCNINYKLPTFIPVVFHNLSGYDAHFIIPELGRDDGAIDVLATSTEKFISFSKKVGHMKLRFLDSFRFAPSSLLTLSRNLREQDLIQTKKIVPADKLHLALRKGVFPYDYIDSPARFEDRQLPPRAAFYNKLTDTEVSDEDYQHACNVWRELGVRTLGDYSDFYIKLDVTLLADVMQEFRNTCISAYGLDPFHSYTSPGLAWQAMLKDTKCSLQLLQDIDMIHMVESGVRGGLVQCMIRYVKANNKYLPDYDDSVEPSYIGYFDANNLYGWAMSMPLPWGDFKWVAPPTVEDVCQLNRTGDVGYILECDFEYPDNLHDHCHDLPLLPKTMIPPNGKHPKLMTTLENKERYVAHFWIVQQALELGLRITKIHRALQFSQSCWLRQYISSNTVRRAAATSTFQKDFYKLMNNSIFGKCLENKRKHKDIKLVTTARQLEKLVQKPNFKTSIIINENLVAVCMGKTVVKMDRPLYVGMSILDISKYHMYDFHYNKMIAYYGRDNIEIIYMDTDAYQYLIRTVDMYEDLRTFPHKDEFDFSEYPTEHPTYDGGVNKKVLGKFKDETNGLPIQESVGLMSKMYALKTVPTVTIGDDSVEPGVTKKAKGVKTLYVKKKLLFEHYKKCLFEHRTYTARFNSIRSFNHRLFSITETKTCLTSSDDKRKILADGIHTLPYGHFSLRRIDE